MFSHIAIALNNSMGAKKALEKAHQYISKAKPKKISLISVLPVGGNMSLGFTQEAGLGKEFFDTLSYQINQNLKEAKKMFLNFGVEINTSLLAGNPGDEIVRYILENNVDLIFMGSRGRGRLKNHFLGSVSDRVAHHAPCHVYIVH